MADDDKDLVSEIKVVGADLAAKALQDYADKGQKAFDDLAESAKKSSDEVAKATDKNARSGQDVVNNFRALAEAKRLQEDADKRASAAAKESVTNLKNIERAMSTLTKTTVKVGKDLAGFVTKVTALTAAAAAAGAGIGALAVRVAKSQNTQADAFERSNAAQQQAVTAAASAATSQIQFTEQQRQLNRQLALGEITYDQYSATLRSNKQAYNDQIRLTAKLESVQEDARLETERLQKQLADRKVYNDLIDTYGGPLTSALTNLGNTLVGLKKQFVDAFGPAVAAAISVVTNTLNSSGSSISAFFQRLGSQFQAFVSTNAPAIQQALTSIGAAIVSVFDGIIGALPTLLDFFNNQIVPAFRNVAALAGVLTTAFNNLFGTNFSTGALVILAIIFKMVGGFKLLFSTLQLGIAGFRLFSILLAGISLNPLTIAITALIAVLLLLYQNWDTVSKFMQSTWAALVGLFQSGSTTIIEVFSSIADGIRSAFDGVAKFVTDTWNAVVEFFTGIPQTISDIFSQVTTAISDAFTSAFDAVKTYVLSWVETIKSKLQPLIDAIKWIASKTGGSNSGGEETISAFAGGGQVHGPGTGTSDSILAWLSNTEFVMRAKAVRKYGVSFMRAINSGTLDLSRLSKFAAGGLVGALSPGSMAMPRLAFSEPSGGASSGGTLNLSIDNQNFNGLQIPDQETAQALSRYVVQRQLTSGGRAPSWKLPKR